MSSSTSSSTLAALTGKFTNAELNLAGSGGFGPEDDVALISISLKNLPVLDTIGSIDPYLRISSKKPNAESWVQQYITEPIKDNQNPDFPLLALNKARLTGGDDKTEFLIEVLDQDIGAPKDDYVGLVKVSFASLKTLPVVMTLVKTTGTTYEGDGLIIFNSIAFCKGADVDGGPTLSASGIPVAIAPEKLPAADSVKPTGGAFTDKVSKFLGLSSKPAPAAV